MTGRLHVPLCLPALLLVVAAAAVAVAVAAVVDWGPIE